MLLQQSDDVRQRYIAPDSKTHGANMGPTWGLQDPGGPHVVHMNLAIWGSSNTGPWVPSHRAADRPETTLISLEAFMDKNRDSFLVSIG